MTCESLRTCLSQNRSHHVTAPVLVTGYTELWKHSEKTLIGMNAVTMYTQNLDLNMVLKCYGLSFVKEGICRVRMRRKRYKTWKAEERKG